MESFEYQDPLQKKINGHYGATRDVADGEKLNGKQFQRTRESQRGLKCQKECIKRRERIPKKQNR